MCMSQKTVNNCELFKDDEDTVFTFSLVNSWLYYEEIMLTNTQLYIKMYIFKKVLQMFILTLCVVSTFLTNNPKK